MSRDRSKTYYQQHPCGDRPGLRPATVTVGELIEQLSAFPRDLPVIYRMPTYGVFGGGVCTALDGPTRETLEASSVHHPASTWFDEETGEDVPQLAYTEDRPAWDGVVLT